MDQYQEGKFMEKSYYLKVLLLFTFCSLVGCTSTIRPDTKHWHGKNIHKVSPVENQAQ